MIFPTLSNEGGGDQFRFFQCYEGVRANVSVHDVFLKYITVISLLHCTWL